MLKLINSAAIFFLFAQSAHAELLCTWTINDSKGKPIEASMKAPCSRVVSNVGKTVNEFYNVGSKIFKINYPIGTSGTKYKVKINGKQATSTEENRYSKEISTDDLTIVFGYDEVSPNKSLSMKQLQGRWGKDVRSDCKADASGNYGIDMIMIAGQDLIRYGGESTCKIYMLENPSSVDINLAFANCSNEDEKLKEALSYSVSANGKELWMNGVNHYYKCGR